MSGVQDNGRKYYLSESVRFHLPCVNLYDTDKIRFLFPQE